MPEAQPGGPSGEGPAQTNQGVGRVSMIHGEVSTQRGDSGTWSAAVLNQPVVNGDKVSTGPGGRAEVQLDFANILRLGSNSQANIANFSHDHIQIQLSQGLADYSVFNESEAEPEIDTPNVAVHPAHKDVILRRSAARRRLRFYHARARRRFLRRRGLPTSNRAISPGYGRGRSRKTRYKITPGSRTGQ